MIVMIDNYDSFTFNLVQYLGELGAELLVHRNDQIALQGIDDLKPEGIIISPGPGRPEDAGISVDLIQNFTGKYPILGVCLGHQAIGLAFGGKIIAAPVLMHGKTSEIHHHGTGILQNLSNPFTATRYHSLVVDKTSLPDELGITAETEDGTIMALQHREVDVYGVQFHPESILTAEGKTILSNFLQVCHP
jgi:anthranilate synthase/aminodeoxychorismate synthase-like glutamine amidotransferase